MALAESTGDGGVELSSEQRMLLRMRDTLYEGNWEDFTRDLRAKMAGSPHVFDIVPPSAAMRDTIENHLRLIDEMQAWEQEHDTALSPQEPKGS